MYVDSTDAESPPRVRGPPEEESEKELELEKEEEYEEDIDAEDKQDKPPPRNIIPQMRTSYPQAAETTAEKRKWGDP